MVVKNNLTEKFNYNKNGTTIKVSNYLRTSVRFGKTKKMVKEQNTVFPNKNSSMTKVMRSPVNIPPIEIHSPMKMMKYNLDKDFKWSKVEQGGARWSKVKKSKNRVCKEQNLVSNYENIKMNNRWSKVNEHSRSTMS